MASPVPLFLHHPVSPFTWTWLSLAKTDIKHKTDAQCNSATIANHPVGRTKQNSRFWTCSALFCCAAFLLNQTNTTSANMFRNVVMTTSPLVWTQGLGTTSSTSIPPDLHAPPGLHTGRRRPRRVRSEGMGVYGRNGLLHSTGCTEMTGHVATDVRSGVCAVEGRRSSFTHADLVTVHTRVACHACCDRPIAWYYSSLRQAT